MIEFEATIRFKHRLRDKIIDRFSITNIYAGEYYLFMLVLEPDENELLQEESVMIQNEARIEDGIVHITNRRIVYEKKAIKRLRRAEPAKLYIEIPMYEILNVSSAVPKMSLLTKKKLSVEFRDKGDIKMVEFELKRPDSIVETIKNWATTSKRIHETQLKEEDQEKYRRELEMAKAKANKSNINMINLGNSKGSGWDKVEKTDTGKNLPKPTEVVESCPECGAYMPEDSKYCPQCGFKIS